MQHKLDLHYAFQDTCQATNCGCHRVHTRSVFALLACYDAYANHSDTVREAALFREQYHLVDLRQKKLHRNGIERLRGMH